MMKFNSINAKDCYNISFPCVTIFLLHLFKKKLLNGLGVRLNKKYPHKKKAKQDIDVEN